LDISQNRHSSSFPSSSAALDVVGTALPEGKAPPAKRYIRKVSERKASERKAGERKAGGRKAGGRRAGERKASEGKIPPANRHMRKTRIAFGGIGKAFHLAF